MPPPPAPFERDARDAPLPRSQVRTACAVVGCLGVVVVAAVAALVYIVLTLLGNLTPQPGGTEKGKKPAAHRPGPVSPTALKTDRHTVPLAAPFDAVGRAANGRFLLLRVPSRSELAVFDPVEAKVVRTFPLGEPDALFAGGAGKLYVYRPKAKELDQFDLLTGEKDETAKKPDDLDAVEHLVAGAGADAPVFAAAPSAGKVAVIDPAPAAWALHPTRNWGAGGVPQHARAADDGTVVGVAPRDATAPPGRVLRFTAPKSFTPVTLGFGKVSVGHVAPSPDGRFAYTARGVFEKNGRAAVRPDGEFFYALPTAHAGDLFLSVSVGENGKFAAPLQLHLAGQQAATAAIPGVALPTGLTAADDAEVTMDQRIHLWPAAGLLAVLPTSNAAIEVYKIDVPGLLAKSGQKYLMFGSAPPTSVSRGAAVVYEPKVWASPAAAVAYEVSGPDGAAMPGPVLKWTAPATGDAAEEAFKVRAKLPDGRAVEQSFRVVLVDSPVGP